MRMIKVSRAACSLCVHQKWLHLADTNQRRRLWLPKCKPQAAADVPTTVESCMRPRCCVQLMPLYSCRRAFDGRGGDDLKASATAGAVGGANAARARAGYQRQVATDRPVQALQDALETAGIFRGAVGGLMLRVLVPVAAVAAVLMALKALNGASHRRGETRQAAAAAVSPQQAASAVQEHQLSSGSGGLKVDSAAEGEAAEPAPPIPLLKPPAWLQRKVVVCIKDVASREDLAFQLLDDVRCLMTFEVCARLWPRSLGRLLS